MTGFALKMNMNMNNFRLLLLALLLLAFRQEAVAQVLTLNSSECVKVEAKLSERVYNSQYKEAESITGGSDVLPLNIEEYKKQVNDKIDSLTTYVEDKVVIFFIWKENHLLRLITRKENDIDDIESINRCESLTISSISISDIDDIYKQMNKLKGKANCNFISNSYRNNYGIIRNFKGIPLVVKNDNHNIEYYRIFIITGHTIAAPLNNSFNIQASIVPNFSIHTLELLGFSIEEKRQMVKESEQDNYLDKLILFFKQIFLKERINYTSSSFRILSKIYDETLLTHFWSEASQPIPYLTSKVLKQWPWSFLSPFNWKEQKRFTPLYGRNSVKGYYYYDEELHPETKGYVVVPGKFFLPRRLQIVSVNNVPWQE